ncbi:hypothetical protein L210DRAFT_939744, partial [Boletus edulis BED1]
LSSPSSHWQPSTNLPRLRSHWVCTHVEPALYYTVRLRSARSLVSFISTLNSKPPGFTHPSPASKPCSPSAPE